MQNSSASQNRLLNVEELAGILNVPVTWIYERSRQGSPTNPIPTIKVGRYVRFHLPSVMEWLKNTNGLERKV